MDDRLYIAEDHRFATSYEVRERTREQLTYLPHIPGDDLQVLCDELAGFIRGRESRPLRVLVFASGGTAAFLAKYIESFQPPVRSILWFEPRYESSRLRSELLQLRTTELVPQGSEFSGTDLPACVILAPTCDLLGWMGVMRRIITTDDCRYLAYDPDRSLRNYSALGSYAYAVSRIWCGR